MRMNSSDGFEINTPCKARIPTIFRVSTSVVDSASEVTDVSHSKIRHNFDFKSEDLETG